MRTLTLALVLAPLVGAAQLLSPTGLDSVRTFRSLESALKDPEAVYKLDLSQQKLKELPEEVRRMKNLNVLILHHNKLKVLPDWLKELGYLQELSAGRNKFSEFPQVICDLKNLKRLDLSRNSLPGLPACMGGLDKLVSLDLWSNDLAEFPQELEGMTALRFLDLRVISFNQEEMDHISSLFPRAKIWFSQPCNCGDP